MPLITWADILLQLTLKLEVMAFTFIKLKKHSADKFCIDSKESNNYRPTALLCMQDHGEND